MPVWHKDNPPIPSLLNVSTLRYLTETQLAHNMSMYPSISQQVKGKVVAVQTIRAYEAGGGRRGIAPLILTRRRARLRLVAYITPRTLYPRKKARNLTIMSPGGQNVSVDVSNKRKISYPYRVSNPGPSSPTSSCYAGSPKTCTNISWAVITFNTSLL